MNSGWLNFKQTDFLQDTKSTNLMGEQIVDAVTRATPLAKEISRKVYSYLDLFFGNVPGCIGEVSAIAIILGGLYLIYKGYVNWRVPSGFIGTVFIFSWVMPPGIKAPWANDPLYHILAGGLMLGAFFMATDMVTTPLTNKGLTIFGIGCGLLTVLIRFYGGYPEGVCYSILLMNTATPLIDRCTQPKLPGTSNRKRM
jgi:electron transport complex protein RnfD